MFPAFYIYIRKIPIYLLIDSNHMAGIGMPFFDVRIQTKAGVLALLEPLEKGFFISLNFAQI